LEFSTKYHEEAFPETYAGKHRASVSRRLNDRLEQGALRRCLRAIPAPDSLVDVGCGPGRFWQTLADFGIPSLAALDVSEAMLRYARQNSPEPLAGRFTLTAGSVLALPFADDAFDCVVSMRLLHHFGNPDERAHVLSELARIARGHVIVSLWTDGNYKAWRRARMERRRQERRPGRIENRHVVPRQTLELEFQAAGLRPVSHVDLIPAYSQWRFYVLEKTLEKVPEKIPGNVHQSVAG
jgi:SAM-dependent methyltransferase